MVVSSIQELEVIREFIILSHGPRNTGPTFHIGKRKFQVETKSGKKKRCNLAVAYFLAGISGTFIGVTPSPIYINPDPSTSTLMAFQSPDQAGSTQLDSGLGGQ